MDPETARVHLDQTLRIATEGKTESNNRPDATAIRFGGQALQVERVSPGDRILPNTGSVSRNEKALIPKTLKAALALRDASDGVVLMQVNGKQLNEFLDLFGLLKKSP